MLDKSLFSVLQQKNEEQAETIKNLHQIITELKETINDLRRTNSEANQAIDILNKTIDELNQTIKDLTEKLGKNSKNSSKPPSTDGLNKPSPKSLRKPTGKNVGGQYGHPGAHLEKMADPDVIIPHMPTVCHGCPHQNVCTNRACVGETRQVIDATVTVNVTEHQSLVIQCPMRGEQLSGEFPDEIKATVQYGENLQALTVALNTVGAVSVNRTHEILSGVFGIPLSTGTVSNMVGRCSINLTGILDTIRQTLTASRILHNDETGTRVDGKTLWVHNASNSEWTYLTISNKRGKVGMDAGGILPVFTGISVHDCWAPYWKYLLILHALCCAHLLRELIGVEENHPDQKWATDFIELLLEMKKAKDHAIEIGEKQLSQVSIQEFERLYDQIIEQGYAENPPPETTEKKRGRKKKGKVLSLIERLDKYKASVCLFINNFDVPFDNNQAERDLRMVKTKTKVSGCFRSIVGAQNYLNIMSYVGTVKKHGISAYEAIRQAILGKPDFFLNRES